MKNSLFILIITLFGLSFTIKADEFKIETETINGLEIHWQLETPDTVKTILRDLVGIW